MKTNKLDSNIKEKFANRSIEPSVSAWERLSAQLDEQPKQKKKGWFFYIGYAASILALISIGIYSFSDSYKQVEQPKQIIVEEIIDTTSILNKIEQHFNEIPVEKAIVATEIEEKKEMQQKKKQLSNVIANLKATVLKTKKEPIKKIATIEEDVQVLDEKKLNKKEIIASVKEPEIIIKEKNNSRIKVNAADLLFAVTSSSNEVKELFIKNNVSREDLLKTIKNELQKSNLKVNPQTILAEVERTINDDAFENNFLKSLKTRITNIATAIASRND